MTKVFVVATGLAGDPATMAHEPRYRKATRNMILANNSIERLMTAVPSNILPENSGLVLGSCHGELAVTVNFLKTLSETGVARPILFQNSLHNSTTGFVSMAWKITGPMVTVSGLHFTGEDALDTGMNLIRRKQCRFCLVTAVEAGVDELVDGLSDSKIWRQYRGEGAASVLLASEEALADWQREPLCELLSVDCVRDGEKAKIEESEILGTYESDAIARLISALSTKTGQLRLDKPDGGHSVIRWNA